MKLTWLYKGVWVWTLYSKRVEAEVSDRKWGKSLWKLVLPFVLFVFVLLILFCTSKDFTLPEPFFCLLDFGVLERTLSLKKKKDKASVRHKGTSALERKREVRCNIIVCSHRLVLFLSYVFWRSSPQSFNFFSTTLAMSRHTSHLTR